MPKPKQKVRRRARPYRVEHGGSFRLRRFDPHDTGGLSSKEDARKELARDTARMRELQDKLYADNRWAVLLIFQAMDAAGKDSTIAHVMSGLNPQGCQVFAFKAPSEEELDHDFLWRTTTRLPERGRIGIFNRSYYEEVLTVRVHPELLARQRLPATSKEIWKARFEDISSFERYLSRNGVLICKFFLYVSRDEQRRRFLERLEEPSKNWKFSAGDLEERKHWRQYMHAYEDMIRHTASPHAPWYVVPADHKWFTRTVVAAAVVDALEKLDLSFPTITREKRRELRTLAAALRGNKAH